MNRNSTRTALAAAFLVVTSAFGVGQVASAGDATLAQRIEALDGETLVLHVAGDVAVALFFKKDGTVSYVDIHLDVTYLGDSYFAKAKWKVQGENVCIDLKGKEDVPCMPLPVLERGKPVTVPIVTYLRDGKQDWTGSGLLVLLQKK
jgi:hypothetical protein